VNLRAAIAQKINGDQGWMLGDADEPLSKSPDLPKDVFQAVAGLVFGVGPGKQVVDLLQKSDMPQLVSLPLPQAEQVAISLASTFGFYGLVRKKVDINSLHGLLVETAILVPLAIATALVSPAEKMSLGTWGLLSLSGIITPIALLLFGAALGRLKLSTVGILQYIGPTLQFLAAVCLFQEPLDGVKLASFILCWLAIGVYSADSFVSRRPQVVADEPE
jgi:hypothetical protein